MAELFTEDELFEAEYKLQNRIRVTTDVERFTTEVYTGLRWVPVAEYVQALLQAAVREELYKFTEKCVQSGRIKPSPNSLDVDNSKIGEYVRLRFLEMAMEHESAMSQYDADWQQLKQEDTKDV